MEKSVYQLPQIVSQLHKDDRAIFERLYNYDSAHAQLKIPETMRAYCEKFFGSVQAVENQHPIKITNRITLDTVIYNQLRARRPQTYNATTLEEQIQNEIKYDPFINPQEGTAEDIFGRVFGNHSITASNVAKFDIWHSVIIFNEYHPLKFSAEQVTDYLMTARAWAEMALQEDSEAAYFFFMWNCLFKAGASIMHGHAQTTLTRQQHYGKVERLRRDALEYHRQHKRSFFNDLIQVHKMLGLASEPAERVIAIANLTPLAEREFWLITDLWSPELGLALYRVLDYYRSVGAVAFNVGAYLPPIATPPGREDWSGFPVILRIVERGDPNARSSDLGALNLFAANALVNDPFEVASGFRQYLSRLPG